jgi:hypothetical protein
MATQEIQTVLVEIISVESAMLDSWYRLIIYSRDDSFASPVCLYRPGVRSSRIIHFNVTEHPKAAWAAQQVIAAFPEDCAPRFMVRDRDGIYGES